MTKQASHRCANAQPAFTRLRLHQPEKLGRCWQDQLENCFAAMKISVMPRVVGFVFCALQIFCDAIWEIWVQVREKRKFSGGTKFNFEVGQNKFFTQKEKKMNHSKLKIYDRSRTWRLAEASGDCSFFTNLVLALSRLIYRNSIFAEFRTQCACFFAG